MTCKTFRCGPCDYRWERETDGRRSRCPYCRKRRKEELRMFVCGPCSRKWWTRGTSSSCFECTAILAALPYEKEYGIGKYTCSTETCGNVFYLRTQANVESECYQCGEWCYDPLIIPNKFTLNRETNNRHSCRLCGGRGNCPSFAKIINVSRRRH